jgi:hypothetical protein
MRSVAGARTVSALARRLSHTLHLLHWRVLPLRSCDAKREFHANRALILCVSVEDDGNVSEEDNRADVLGNQRRQVSAIAIIDVFEML